jgi:hypothetical protein
MLKLNSGVSRGGSLRVEGRLGGGAAKGAAGSRRLDGAKLPLDLDKIKTAFGADVCQYYLDGRCRFADCRFAHSHVFTGDERKAYEKKGAGSGGHSEARGGHATGAGAANGDATRA